MTKVFKGGTIITADRQFEADVLIDGEKTADLNPLSARAHA